MQVTGEPGSSARLYPASGFSGTGKLIPVPGHVPRLLNLIGKSLGSLHLPEAGKGKFPSAHPAFLLPETGSRAGWILELSSWS